MNYSSPYFLVFFLPVFLFYGCAQNQSARLNLILVASLVFYSFTGFVDSLIFASVVLVSWFSLWLARLLRHGGLDLPLFRRVVDRRNWEWSRYRRGWVFH